MPVLGELKKSQAHERQVARINFMTALTKKMDDLLDLEQLFEAQSFDSKFQTPADHIDFMKFPVEMRAEIINHYLQGELKNGTLKKHMHTDRFGMPCCVWNWPDELIICDKVTPARIPHIMFPKWLPYLALTNKHMRGEVLVHMLRTTSIFVLKYEAAHPVKIAPWFGQFLGTFPNNEGFGAIRDLDFPHMHWFNHYNDVPVAAPNPDVTLMLQCPELCRVGMTFHFTKLASFDQYLDTSRPLCLNAFLNEFKLRPMLSCDKLEEVYIGGIMFHDADVDGDQLQALRDFGKWLHEEFAKKTPPQKVTVRLYPRYSAFNGWKNPQEL